MSEKNQKNSTKFKDTINNSVDKLKDLYNVKAIVYYFFDIENLHFSEKRLTTIQPNIKIIETNEVYKLDKPACYKESIPIFILIKGIPYSIKLDFKPQTKENIDGNEVVLEDIEKAILMKHGNRPEEICSLLDSVHTVSFFKKQKVEFKDILVVIVFVLFAIALTYIITVNSINPQIITKYIEVIKYVNETEPIILPIQNITKCIWS